MKQLLLKSGKVKVHDVPAPSVSDNFVLVRVSKSCISVGTEISGVKSSKENLLLKAIRNPHHVRTVLSMISESGIKKVSETVRKKLDIGTPIGYSASGTVIDVGKNIRDVKIGDRVACAGSEYASHAEIISVPRNLIAKIPNNVTDDVASTVTLGSIALQGLRRAELTYGETVVVIGLGVIGQILLQLLSNSGVKVIGIDIDSSKLEIAKQLGFESYANPNEQDIYSKINHYTNGYGADSVIVTASSTSSDIISDAFKLCRKKARVVLIGDVGLNIKREDIYEKELDFLISSSYGPGRYDPTYEEGGIDYPYHYVRWTENRNMEQYLDFLSKNQGNIEQLISSNTEIDNATSIYEKLLEKNNEIISLISYPLRDEDEVRKTFNKIEKYETKKNKRNNITNIGIVGAGSFAKGMHLPNLQKLNKLFKIKAVMSRSGHNAQQIGNQYKADLITTNYDDLLKDESIDAVLISTRHNLHGKQVIKALESGKNVFVEKPLCINRVELEEIEKLYTSNEVALPILLTGFNRRFSPDIKRIKKLVDNRVNPMIINYQMNAGYIPLDNWVHNEEGGGRNIGEACHIYDLFTYLTSSEYISLRVSSIHQKTKSILNNDNFIATINFKDGSIANLLYTAIGSTKYPKESMNIYFDQNTVSLSDYKNLSIYNNSLHKNFKRKYSSKGQFEELQEFGKILQKGGVWPIPLWQQIQSTKIALDVEDKLQEANNNES